MKNFKDSELEEEMLEEAAISSAFSTITAIFLIKKIITPWKSWDAYKLELLDDKGRRTEKKAVTREEKESLNTLNQFIIGLRRIFLTFMSEGILKILISLYITKTLIKK